MLHCCSSFQRIIDTKYLLSIADSPEIGTSQACVACRLPGRPSETRGTAARQARSIHLPLEKAGEGRGTNTGLGRRAMVAPHGWGRPCLKSNISKAGLAGRVKCRLRHMPWFYTCSSSTRYLAGCSGPSCVCLAPQATGSCSPSSPSSIPASPA